MISFSRKRVKDFKDYYKNLSIQHIISISFTAVAMVGILLVGISLHLRYTNAAKEMASENNRAVLEQVNMNLDSYLRNMMKVSDSMYYRVIKKTDLSKADINYELGLLYEANKDYIVGITLFSEGGKVVDGYPLTQLKKSVDPRDTQWFSDAVNRKENLHFSTPHVQNLFVDPTFNYHWVVSLSRSVELIFEGAIESGVLLVDMNFRGIEQICKNANVGKDGYVYLIDSDGELIYHPRQQLIYSNLIEENNTKVATFEDGVTVDELKGEKRLVTVKTVGYTGWKIVGVTPMKSLTAGYYETRVFVIFIMIFALFILISLNMFIASRITNPIRALERSVKKLENGVKDVDISISGSYEVQHLGKAIKSMVNQMHILMDNIVLEQEEKRKSELNALQAQINPHFLYNTLDSIIWMIENESYEGAIIMVTALARFFRISLSKGKNIITVAMELEHVKNYLTIQEIRYKNKFTYTIEAEEATLNLASLKLIVQPLIENAIYHGMEFMGGDGEIEVKAYIKDNDLYIDVIDNGMGMEQEEADELLTGENKSKGKGSGVGLRNVHDRIQLYFGRKYGLKIISEPDEGVIIHIHMPCIDINDVQKMEGLK